MARSKAATKPKVDEQHLDIAKDLKPKDADAIYFGPEPKFAEQPLPEKREHALGKAFNWYTRFYDTKDAKEFMLAYLENSGKTDKIKSIKKVSDSNFIPTLGWVARLSARGLVLTDKEKKRLDDEITRIFSFVTEADRMAIKQEADDAVAAANKKSIQDVMKERASDVAGELEGLMDEFVASGCKTVPDHTSKIVNHISDKNILPQHIPIILASWVKMKNEFIEVSEGSCDQLTESYSHYSKSQIKNALKFVDQVIDGINAYVSIKKATKAKRVRKAVPVEKIVSKLKYLRTFKDANTKLDLVSIHPTKLHNASEAWVYDTAKRKLYHYIADEYSKSLLVKGNTLLGYDKKESEAKILRKPNEQIKQVMGSKPAARKFFKDIKAVATSPNGRFNPNMVILKAF